MLSSPMQHLQLPSYHPSFEGVLINLSPTIPHHRIMFHSDLLHRVLLTHSLHKYLLESGTKVQRMPTTAPASFSLHLG